MEDVVVGNATGSRMRDLDIRLALLQHLNRAHGHEPDALIVSELGLCQGAARVDLAVINGSLNGYEIKSERDTLERLPGQQEIYNRALDSVTVVASQHHIDSLTEQIPCWWGIWEARAEPTAIRLITIRSPGENPHVDPSSMVQLLWRDEVLAALTELGLQYGVMSKPRGALWAKLVENISLHELRELVRSRLKARTGWRAAQ